MEEPKDFQLLDDDDDVTSSPLFDLNFNIGGSISTSNGAVGASNSTNNNKKIPIGINQEFNDSKSDTSHQILNTIKIQNKSNTTMTVTSNQNYQSGNNQQQNSNVNFNTITIEKPKASKFNISPNKPNANARLELKSIERPRSHSPLKMKGIEEYVQLYASNAPSAASAQTSNNSASANKITMNLKIDDLLANVKNESSYQMLSDFSFLTGDNDPLSGVDSNSKAKTRKKSLDHANLQDQSFNTVNPANDDYFDGDGDDDDDDDDESKRDEKGNLKYKFTAVYKKDEVTGSFQEKSKIIFENKATSSATLPSKPRPPVPPPPTTSSFQSTNISSPNVSSQTSFVQQNLPSQPFSDYTPAQHQAPLPPQPVSNQPQLSPQSQLASALEALRHNSKALESKLDKIEDITPSPNSYFDVSALPDVEENQLRTTNEEQTGMNQTPIIKKKNDSFFNEFLTKSDDLIAQTQSKLEKLSKLESVTKPVAPPPPPPQVVKPKPMATIIDKAPAPTPVSNAIILTNTSSGINLQTTSNIKDSKSLIDLKSSQSSTQISNHSGDSASAAEPAATEVDLLFDINNEQSFTLNTEPLKQGDSYFDLIGLSSTSTTNESVNVTSNQHKFELPPDLLKLTEPEEPTSTTPARGSPFKDELLDLMINEPFTNELSSYVPNLNKITESDDQKEEDPPIQFTSAPPSSKQPIDAKIPSIDILITEPLNEKDDNNIVPEGLFNLKHEIPYDQSRPHSPTYLYKGEDTSSTATTPTMNTNSLISNATAALLNQSASSNQVSEIQLSPSITQNDLDLDFFTNNEPPANPEPISKPAPKPVETNISTIQPVLSGIARSRPVTPSQRAQQQNDTDKPNSFFSMFDESATLPRANRKQKKENKVRVFKNDIGSSAASSAVSSSSSSDDDDEQKFQIRIRPKPVKSLQSLSQDNEENKTPKPFVPLLPRPPKSQQEIEEFRQRRQSSESASITRSLKEDDSSENEDNFYKKPDENKENQQDTNNEAKTEERRKSSVHSEYNLELPDEDDSLPLCDFNDKCQLNQYSDGTYGCMVLVRQPFRDTKLIYKNALQKMTEVRTWTECLVRLVQDPKAQNGKKLVFYNAHELITLAAEHDTTLEKIIENCVINGEEKVEEPSEESSSTNQAFKKIPPFHQIELKSSYKFSDMCLQQFDTYTKIHTFKMQDVVFKETIQVRPDRLMALPERFLKRFTKAKATSLLDHTPLPLEICKFAHSNYFYLRSFLLLLQDAFWALPTVTRKIQREQQLIQLQQQSAASSMSITAAAASFFSLSNKQVQTPALSTVTSSHTREQITVKVVDEYKCKLDAECRIKEHKNRTRVFLITFLNAPDPIIEIGLNDCLRHGKEIVGRHDIIPIKTEQWISPEIFEINENVVEKEEFEKTHCLKCVQMPDNVLVEILRYRTRPRRNYELPIQVRCYMHVVGRIVEIRIECTVAGTYYTNLSEVHCEDIQIRFPLPDVWVYLFRVEKRFRYGAVHSTKHKFGKIKGLDRFLVHKTANQSAIMEASCGMAKYEQAFKSLVWRIDQLPVKNKDIYKTHLFICKLNLQEYDNLPDSYEQTCYVQYSIPICAASKSQVRSVSVNTCEEPPEKWVKLKSKFEYELDINYSFDQKELPAVDKEKCAELQQLPQTESEGDNNEEEDNDD